ncbi:MAG: GntR family transcriptional regulator [Pseudomonadota bacterium]
MTAQTIVRNTISEQVFLELRRRIATGQLQPGERLRPDDISRDLNVSQTPVKEAFLRLDAEGLVDTVPRRGTIVRRVSRRHTVELFRTREMIETWALRDGFANDRITEDFLAAIGETVEELSSAVANDRFVDIEKAMKADRSLHYLIVGLTGNSIMIDWYRRVMSQTEFIRLYATRPERATETETEHKEIYAALQSRDLDGTLLAIEEHFQSACNSLLPIISAEKEEPEPETDIAR